MAGASWREPWLSPLFLDEVLKDAGLTSNNTCGGIALYNLTS
jgi:hypothetical protein